MRCPDLANLLAKVLAAGIHRLARSGFERRYEPVIEVTPRLRGRIQVADSYRRMTYRSGRMKCEFDELSGDAPANRVLHATASRLLGIPDLTADNRHELRLAREQLPAVTQIRVAPEIDSFPSLLLSSNIALMRILLFSLCLATTAVSQTPITRILEQGLKDAANTFKPVSAAEKLEVLTATAALLAKHVTFRPDGTASATFHLGKAQPVEWRKLVVDAIHPEALTDADRLNGITRRYHASLSCDASRSWQPATNAWSEWRPVGVLLFPSAIVIEEKNRVLIARGNDQLPKFMPGPGTSLLQKQPSGNRNDLPPGMTRGR